jgi:hypothetical protein
MTTKTHKELFSVNDEYNPELNEKLRLLYEGGYAIKDKADLFLKQLKGIETRQAYDERKSCVSYIPYLSEFITQFSASLFSEQLEVKVPGDATDDSTLGEDMTDDFYKMFMQNCDENGKSFHQFMQDVFDTALYELKVYVGIDFPTATEMPNNLAEEEALGLSKGYAFTIPYNSVIDWKKDHKNHTFIWLKTFDECFPDDDPYMVPTHYFQFKIYERTPDGKAGAWKCWQSQRMPLNRSYNDRTVYTLVEEGTTSFPGVNIFDFHIPKGFHVGQQIGSICEEHYQRRSFLVSNANKSCVSLGVVTLGPEIGAPGDAVPMDIPNLPKQPNMLRQQLESDGWTVVRAGQGWKDEVQIIEAKGESHRFISEELASLVEQMMQTLRQMNMNAEGSVKALGRSAASKLADQHGTSMLLSYYDRRVKDFVKKYFTFLGVGRKDEIHWDVEGLSVMEPVLDRKDLITEMTSLGIDVLKFPDIFKNKYLYRLAIQLLNNDLSEKEKLELQQKINDAISSGEFESIDETEATAAGNKMAKAVSTSEQDLTAPNATTQMGPGGQPLAPDSAHLQTGQHIDSSVVYNQLVEDYKPKDIEFVKHIPWVGPQEVPLTSIDFSNKDNWQASSEPDKVDKFANMMKNEQFSKPIILVNNPSNDNKMSVVDGHHRALAAVKNNMPVSAYIGQVGSDGGPWDKLHSKQVGSMQKQVSNQVKNSEDGNK